MIRQLFALIMLFWSVSSNAVDHSQCARFFNIHYDEETNELLPKVHSGGPYVPQRYRYVPYRILDDGTVSVVDQDRIVDVSTTDDGLRTSIIYRSAPVVMLESYSYTLMEIASQNGEATVTIIRNESDGSIAEIFEELPSNLSRNEYYSRIIGTRTTFEVRNDKCVPVMSAEILETAEGRRTQVIRFIVDYCRDTLEFNRKHSIDIFFSDELSYEMQQLMLRYAGEFFILPDGYEGFFEDEQMHDLLSRHTRGNQSDMNSLLVQAYVSYQMFQGGNQHEMMRLGISPVIGANMALGTCYDLGLSEFLEDDTLWEN